MYETNIIQFQSFRKKKSQYQQQSWPERGFLGLRHPPNILETTPALFNHIRKNEFPFTTILVGDCRDHHESSISKVFASFRGN